MSEKKRKRIIYAILALAVIWGLYNQPWKSRRRTTTQDTHAASVPASTASVPVVSAAPQTAVTASVTGWLVDPFRPANTDKPDPGPVSDEGVRGELVLQGTLVVQSTRVCVINGQTRRVGDDVGAWHIVRIAEGEVTLVGFDNEHLTLRSRRIDRERSDNPS